MPIDALAPHVAEQALAEAVPLCVGRPPSAYLTSSSASPGIERAESTVPVAETLTVAKSV